MWSRRNLLVAVVGVLFLWVGDAAPASAPQKAGKVTLILVSATAERKANGDVWLNCEVVLDNQTGRDLFVESSFFSAFDGLTVVASDKNGRRLVRQGSTWHQSPNYPSQKFVLPKGKNEREMT